MTYKIPSSTKQIIQTNDSDFSGNLWYGRNLDLTEKGYIKLSPRAVSMVNEGTEISSQFLLPLSFFGSSDTYQVATAKKVMAATIAETNWSFDSVVYSPTIPNAGYGSQGVAWQGKFYVSYDNGISAGVQYTTNGGSDWTDTGISLTVGVTHCLEVFDSRPGISDGKPVLAVSNGNTVILYNTSYSSEATLTLGSKYSITDITFSFNKIGISTTATDEAVFFTWDGSAATNPSGCPVGAIGVISSVAYKSSFAILTVRGQLRYYTGGGFQELAALPFFYKNYVWGQQMLGTCLIADNDLIYINMGTAINIFNKNQGYMQNFPGGILCYDPKVGIYHRYSPSQSMIYELTVTSGNINTSTDTFTSTQAVLAATGTPIKYVSDKTSLIGGLTAGIVYYIINLDSTHFKLATTKQNALDGAFIDITSTGAASNNFLSLNLVDYGVSYTTGIQGAIKIPSTHTLTHEGVIFGTQVQALTSTTLYANLDIIVSGFKNIGYMVTSKLYSAETEDRYQNIIVKYRPLNTDDKIIAKFKEKDVLGLPVATTLGINNCTWTSTTTLTTTRDLSAAYTAISAGVNLECEIIGGAGAGQLSQVTSMGFNAGTYTVTLTDAIEGATTSQLCDILLDNWTKIGEITSSDILPFKEFGTTIPSTWFKIKLELRGIDTTVEELTVNNVSQFK